MSTIDKVVIYGVANPERLKLTEVLSNNIKVTTLQMYSKSTIPLKKKDEVDFEMWAYPDGIKIYNSNLQILNDSQPQFSFFESTDILSQAVSSSQIKTPPQYVYSFVLTGYDLNRTYCTCIIWNERYFIKDDRSNLALDSQLAKSLTESMDNSQKKILFEAKQKYSLAIPKCKIETMINNPLILDANTIPVFVPKAMIVCSKIPCLQLQRSLLKYYHDKMIKEHSSKIRKSLKIPRLFESQFNQLIKNFGYNKAESIFDSQKSQTIRKIQLKLLKMTFKQGQREKYSGFLNVETVKLKQFFISSLFTMPEDSKNSFVFSDSGVSIASRLKSDTVFQLPKIFDIFSESDNQEKLTNSLIPLPVPQFIQLWKCVLLEKQIIIFSNSQLKSIVLSQIMLHLIQPIKWQNIYIPFLPFHLAHHIEAIGGYVIGMSRIHMDYMLEKFQMKNKVVVDMEHKTILEQGGKQVIELPQQIKSYLQKSLTSILQSYEESCKPNRGLINYLITSKHEPGPKQKIKTIQSFVKHWLEIQKLFFHALVMLFNNFIPFIVKKQGGIIAVQTEEYLNILDDRLHRSFMKEISKTMVFIRLCQYHVEESEKCAWVQKNIGQLFVYSHDILSHKFVVTNSDMSRGKAEESKIQWSRQLNNQVIKNAVSKQKAYAWTVQDLLLEHEKYYQYIDYLFNKNLKELTDAVISIGFYLGQEQRKYRILNSQDQFQSFETLQSIQLPADFGKKLNSKKNSPSTMEKGEKQLQYRKIYQKIESQQVANSKKNKKYGDKDQEQLYDEFSKLCTDLKIQKFLIKYLKYMEMNHPEAIIKIASKGNKKQKSNSGILNWFWDLVNPPDSNRGRQEMEVKSKLQRKMTIRNVKIESALNLRCLFGSSEQERPDVRDQFVQYESNKKVGKNQIQVEQLDKKQKNQLIESQVEAFKQGDKQILASINERENKGSKI